MVVRVGGLVRQRFIASATAPVIVGRAPEDRNGLSVADLLDERVAAGISRSHLTVEMRADGPYVTDTSTNGTVLVPSSGERSRLVSGQPYRLGEQDAVELSDGVQIARAGAVGAADAAGAPGSVMADAPTVAIEMPRSM
jgi:predicted component of type VI protein secretion system